MNTNNSLIGSGDTLGLNQQFGGAAGRLPCRLGSPKGGAPLLHSIIGDAASGGIQLMPMPSL